MQDALNRNPCLMPLNPSRGPQVPKTTWQETKPAYQLLRPQERPLPLNKHQLMLTSQYPNHSNQTHSQEERSEPGDSKNLAKPLQLQQQLLHMLHNRND